MANEQSLNNAAIAAAVGKALAKVRDGLKVEIAALRGELVEARHRAEVLDARVNVLEGQRR